MTIPYNPASSKADEFINHEEIMETLAYADEKSQDKEFCLSLVEKASHLKGLSHREASVLLKSEDSDVTEAIYDLARKIEDKIMVSASSYLRPFIFQTTVSMGVSTVPIMPRTDTSPGRN